MSSLLNDYQIFFSSIFDSIKKIYSWIFTTAVGEVYLFTIIIAMFFLILYIINEFKN